VGGRVVSDRLPAPLLNLLASEDRIAPGATAPAGNSVRIPSGHVGMVVGSARGELHRLLGAFLDPRLAARATCG
jgi:polyhydroxyalkanoate synthase